MKLGCRKTVFHIVETGTQALHFIYKRGDDAFAWIGIRHIMNAVRLKTIINGFGRLFTGHLAGGNTNDSRAFRLPAGLPAGLLAGLPADFSGAASAGGAG